MGERIQIPIPMWRVQIQLLGGHLRLAVIGGAYLALLVVATVVIRRLARHTNADEIAYILLIVLMVFQLATVVLGGCHAVYKGMNRDFQSHMLESHRLTPMSNTAVVVGYWLGTTAQILVLFGVNICFGVGLALWGEQSAPAWINGNLLFLSGALMLWAVTVFGCLRPDKPLNPSGPLIGVAVFSWASLFLPVAGILTAGYSFVVGAFVVTGAYKFTAGGLVISSLFSLVLAGFWLHVSAVKYRRPDLPALNGFRGLLLLTIALVLGVGGMSAFSAYVPGQLMFGSVVEMAASQWTATIGLCLFLTLVAISGTVECARLIGQGTAPRGRTDRMPSLLVVLLAGALFGAILFIVGWPVWKELPTGIASEFKKSWTPWAAWVYTMIAIYCALLFAHALYAIVEPVRKIAKGLVVFAILTLWTAPVLVDSVSQEMLGRNWSPLAGCAPIGTFIGVWNEVGMFPLIPGLAAQAALATVLTLVAWQIGKRRRSAKRADPKVAPPPTAPPPIAPLPKTPPGDAVPANRT